MNREQMIDEAVRRYFRLMPEELAPFAERVERTIRTPYKYDMDTIEDIRAEFRRLADAWSHEVVATSPNFCECSCGAVIPLEAWREHFKPGPTVEETTAAQPDCPDCGGKKWPEHICPKRPHLEQFLKQAHAE